MYSNSQKGVNFSKLSSISDCIQWMEYRADFSEFSPDARWDCRWAETLQKFSKVSYTDISHSKSSSKLTFQNFHQYVSQQVPQSWAAEPAPPPPSAPPPAPLWVVQRWRVLDCDHQSQTLREPRQNPREETLWDRGQTSWWCPFCRSTWCRSCPPAPLGRRRARISGNCRPTRLHIYIHIIHKQIRINMCIYLYKEIYVCI